VVWRRPETTQKWSGGAPRPPRSGLEAPRDHPEVVWRHPETTQKQSRDTYRQLRSGLEVPPCCPKVVSGCLDHPEVVWRWLETTQKWSLQDHDLRTTLAASGAAEKSVDAGMGILFTVITLRIIINTAIVPRCMESVLRVVRIQLSCKGQEVTTTVRNQRI